MNPGYHHCKRCNVFSDNTGGGYIYCVRCVESWVCFDCMGGNSTFRNVDNTNFKKCKLCKRDERLRNQFNRLRKIIKSLDISSDGKKYEILNLVECLNPIKTY